MYKKWEKWDLPNSVEINKTEYTFDSNFKTILKLFEPLNDLDLTVEERIECAMGMFYNDFESMKREDIAEAYECFTLFINGNQPNKGGKEEQPLYDWDKDFKLIIAPINRVAGHELRLDNHVHWWTFLSYFMEIGECTFSTYVSIRSKKAKGKKLEKWEQELYRNNMDDIKLTKKYDSETQSEIDRIMGKTKENQLLEFMQEERG